MSDYNKFSVPPRKNRQSDENVFDFSSSKRAYPPKKVSDTALSYSWHAVSNQKETLGEEGTLPPVEEAPKTAPKPQKAPQKNALRPSQISMAEVSIENKMFKIPEGLDSAGKNLNGQNLVGQNFAKADLAGADFSAADLTGADLSGANLRGADLSGANMTDANLSQADLSGAVLAGANLLRTNFTGAKLNGVTLTEANLEEAILLGVEIDALGIEELQALIEYMAVYYPHKLNLTKLNLTLLDLSKIDLTKVSLRGVDFTGIDFTGINIMELDLSECIITPQQIAQALGRVPTPEEMKMLLAPKQKKGEKGKVGIDMMSLLRDDGREFGTWDALHQEGITIKQILDVGKKIFRRDAKRPQVKDSKILEEVKSAQQKAADENKAALRRQIEEHKRQELENRRNKKQEVAQEVKRETSAKEERREDKKQIDVRIMSRGGNER